MILLTTCCLEACFNFSKDFDLGFVMNSYSKSFVDSYLKVYEQSHLGSYSKPCDFGSCLQPRKKSHLGSCSNSFEGFYSILFWDFYSGSCLRFS